MIQGVKKQKKQKISKPTQSEEKTRRRKNWNLKPVDSIFAGVMEKLSSKL